MFNSSKMEGWVRPSAQQSTKLRRGHWRASLDYADIRPSSVVSYTKISFLSAAIWYSSPSQVQFVLERFPILESWCCFHLGTHLYENMYHFQNKNALVVSASSSIFRKVIISESLLQNYSCFFKWSHTVKKKLKKINQLINIFPPFLVWFM